MCLPRATVAQIVILLAFGATQGASRPVCKPVVSATQARSSDAVNQQRRWTAVLAVDASRCASSAGTFDIDFVREKETGPDLAFTQRFIWRPGPTEIALDLWWDESIRAYQVGDVTACPCRD